MGKCTCGKETVWNDMCEYCLGESEDRMYDDDGLGQELLRAMEIVDKRHKVTEVTSILRSNLMDALNAAICYYTAKGLGKSCAVAGYKEVLEALRAGKHVEVRE